MSLGCLPNSNKVALEAGAVVSKLNILCRDVVDQKREMWVASGWWEAVSSQEPSKKLPMDADARSALLELLLAASGIAQCPDGAMLCHAWGL